MAKTLYSHDARVLPCDHCGAPLSAKLEGGSVRCSYCSAVNQVARRDESQDVAAAEQARAADLSEAERLQGLRAQDNQPLLPPPSLQPLLEGGEIDKAQVKPALDEWLATRKRIKTGAPFAEEERLLHLTLLLGPKLDDRHQRALLEDAVDVLSDKSYRQILRCRLAHYAVLEGDLAAAEQWLRPANPRPMHLAMDTAYRLSSSYLAVAQNQPDRALQLLGYRPDDVPILDGHDLEALLLRCHALEQNGQVAEAQSQLTTAMQSDPGAIAHLGELREKNARLGLCAKSFPPAYQQIWGEIDETIRPGSGRPLLIFIAVLGTIAFVLDAATVYFLGPMILGTTPSDFSTNSAGAIGANTGIWGFFFTLGVGLAIWAAIREQRLARTGVLILAKVVQSSTRKRQGKSGTTTVCDVRVELEHDGQQIEISRTLTRDTPLRLGAYPCLVEPGNPKHLVLKLE